MEINKSSNNTWPTPSNPQKVLEIQSLINLLKDDNDFEEYASLNFLATSLKWLESNQIVLLDEFIRREYEKINQKGTSVTYLYLRDFVNHQILWKFSGDRLTTVLQFLLQYKNIDFRTQYEYDQEIKVAQFLQQTDEETVGSFLTLSEENFTVLTNRIKFQPKVMEAITQNVKTVTDEHIGYTNKIYTISKNEDITIAIFGLFFLGNELSVKNIQNLFQHIRPSFLIYSEADDDTEYVDQVYYYKQVKEIQKQLVSKELSKDDFLKYLQQDYLNISNF
jgi:hypothetical protein